MGPSQVVATDPKSAQFVDADGVPIQPKPLPLIPAADAHGQGVVSVRWVSSMTDATGSTWLQLFK
jgi:hypothetical protein